MLQTVEEYQKARIEFAQKIADLSTRPQNIESLQNADVMSLLRPLLMDNVPSIQQSAALALGRLANYNEDLAEAVVGNGILPQLVTTTAAATIIINHHHTITTSVIIIIIIIIIAIRYFTSARLLPCREEPFLQEGGVVRSARGCQALAAARAGGGRQWRPRGPRWMSGGKASAPRI